MLYVLFENRIEVLNTVRVSRACVHASVVTASSGRCWSSMMYMRCSPVQANNILYATVSIPQYLNWPLVSVALAPRAAAVVPTFMPEDAASDARFCINPSMSPVSARSC